MATAADHDILGNINTLQRWREGEREIEGEREGERQRQRERERERGIEGGRIGGRERDVRRETEREKITVELVHTWFAHVHGLDIFEHAQ